MQKDKNNLGVWEVCKSTLMSFFGVQKESVRNRDFQQGKPVYFIISGIVFTLFLIAILYGVVRLILHFAGL